MTPLFRARTDAKKVMKFIAINVASTELSMKRKQDSQHRQVLQGFLDSYRDAGRRRSQYPDFSWLADQASAYVSGYRTAQLVVAAYAAVIYQGGHPEEFAGIVRGAAARYLAGVRAAMPRLMIWGTDATKQVWVSGHQPPPVDSLDDLVRRHDAACRTIPADLTKIPLSAELTWFRWLAWEQGLLPLKRPFSGVIWLGLAEGIREIPPAIREVLVDRRTARSWVYEAPSGYQ